MVTDTMIMELPDGRELAWLELGDPAGRPVIGFHGTPGSRNQLVLDEAPVRSAGVRLITVDRPGYGHSTFHAGRRLVDWAADVAGLADHLDLERFGVAGVSGGGPHALACAALLPERVSVAGVISGVGPLSAPGDERGMMPLNALVSRVARRSGKPLHAMFALTVFVQRRWPERVVEGMSKQMAPNDAEILARPDVREVFIRDMRKSAATAGKASAQDFELFSRDWGFRLEDIKVPVHFWQGDADLNVPPAHASRMAAEVPGAVLHQVPGGGHMMVVDLIGDILSTLRALI